MLLFRAVLLGLEFSLHLFDNMAYIPGTFLEEDFVENCGFSCRYTVLPRVDYSSWLMRFLNCL